VLNRHDAGVGEQLLGVVVDQLSVDEDIGAVFDDPVDFVPHFLLLGNLELSYFGDGVHLLRC